MITVMSWWCLRMHAGYLCRHAGVCCRTDWEIPAETHVLHAIELSSLRDSDAARALATAAENAVELHVPRDRAGACLFFTPSATGSCAVHAAAGPEALPSACRHFPREFLIDPRGTLVSLSHYCPTAASLLTSPRPLEIVDGTALKIGGAVEGLDATAALPPLLRPGVLTDLDGYAAWESACLAVLSRDGLTASEALDFIEGATNLIREWQPGGPALADAVRLAFASTNAPPTSSGPLAGAFEPLVVQQIPPEALPVSKYEEAWQGRIEGDPGVERTARHYLGARLFANWIAYQGRGLRTIVKWLRACHAVLRNEIALRCMQHGGAATVSDALAAAGRADFVMIHTIDSQAFADFHRDHEHS